VFAAYRIDEQLAKALERKVWLPSGGSLVIDPTEAMTVIDVNTGKFTGQGGNLEQTVTRNNLEAAEEIVRQLRLRDTGGIIVIDFIDMVLESNRDLVLRRLLECLARVRTKHQVAEVTSLGLVQMTRKRVGSGLLEAFSTTCEHCNGRGVLISMEPVDHDHGPASRDDGRGKDEGKSRGGRSRGGKSRSDTPRNGNGHESDTQPQDTTHQGNGRGRSDDRDYGDDRGRNDDRGRSDDRARSDDRDYGDGRGRGDDRDYGDDRGRSDDRDYGDDRGRADDRGRGDGNRPAAVAADAPASPASTGDVAASVRVEAGTASVQPVRSSRGRAFRSAGPADPVIAGEPGTVPATTVPANTGVASPVHDNGAAPADGAASAAGTTSAPAGTTSATADGTAPAAADGAASADGTTPAPADGAAPAAEGDAGTTATGAVRRRRVRRQEPKAATNAVAD
jgi:ribonuclease E